MRRYGRCFSEYEREEKWGWCVLCEIIPRLGNRCEIRGLRWRSYGKLGERARGMQGKIVRKLPLAADKAGLQRISWDLRSASKEAISLGGSGFYNPFAGRDEGPLVVPGVYRAVLSEWRDDKMTPVGDAVSFNVKSLNHHALPATDPQSMVSFKYKAEEVQRVEQITSGAISEGLTELTYMRKAVTQMDVPEESLLVDINGVESKLKAMQRQLSGDPIKAQLDMDPTPSVANRIGRVLGESKYSSSQPTATHMMSLSIAQDELKSIMGNLQEVTEKDMVSLRAKLQKAGSPYIPNMLPAFKGN